MPHQGVTVARSRPKGVRGEREAAALWEAAGYAVRGLEAGGDHLVVMRGLVVAQETKRCERLKLPEWLAQLEADAPDGSLPILTYRQNHEPWRSVLRTVDLVGLAAKAYPPRV